MSTIKNFLASIFRNRSEMEALRRFYEIEFKQSAKFLPDDVVRRNIAEAMFRV